MAAYAHVGVHHSAFVAQQSGSSLLARYPATTLTLIAAAGVPHGGIETDSADAMPAWKWIAMVLVMGSDQSFASQ